MHCIFLVWVSIWLRYWPCIAAPRTNFNVEDEKKTVQYAEIRPQQWKLDDSGRNSRKEPKTTLWRILKTGDDDNDFATKHIENTSRIWQNNTSTRALSSRGLGTILLKNCILRSKIYLVWEMILYHIHYQLKLWLLSKRTAEQYAGMATISNYNYYSMWTSVNVKCKYEWVSYKNIPKNVFNGKKRWSVFG